MIGKRERALLPVKTTRAEISTEEVLFVFICDIKLSFNQWAFVLLPLISS
ncbi:hypothetical protein HXA32_02815 [Salipaludibacillus agaradhaerens]|nr:hypothetical protein [Salipaludibacillus agaradhaerens]MCR6105214.1 hypothetical protein [Salipaludibacillus agaradhaerens]